MAGGKVRNNSAVIQERLVRDSMPIVNDLSRIGVNESLMQLGQDEMTADEFTPIFDVILEHFHRPYMTMNRFAMALSMNAPKAKALVWPHVVRFFADEEDDLVKQALASTLASLATAKDLEQVIAFVEDASNGVSRGVLLGVLSRSRDSRALETLCALQDDPLLKKEVAKILRKKARYAAKKAEREAAKKAGRNE